MSRNPDWTDERRRDPGITILELLVFLAAALLVRLVLRALACRPAVTRDDREA